MVEQRYAFLAVQGFIIVLVLAGNGGGCLLQGGSRVPSGGERPAEGAAVRRSETYDLNAVDGLRQEGVRLFGLGRSLHCVGYGLDGIAVGFLAFLLGGSPGVEIGLLLLLAADDIQLLEGELLALPFLPAVGGTGILAGILEVDGRVGHTRFPHHVLTDGAGVDGDALGGDHLLELCGGLEALGASWIAHDHGEVAVLVALERYSESLLGTVGDVVLAVVCRLVVGTGVHSEHREIAGVAGPHPVVGLAAEFA